MVRLLANASGLWADSPLLRTDVIVATCLLAGALLAGAVAVHLAERWKKQALKEEKTPGEDLALFRTMFERGELTEEEYNKVRLRTAARMKEELGIAPPAPSRPASAETPADGTATSPPTA